ncbi:MAG: aspartate carbamoyltransferase [Planctomycetota bacterium]
MPTISPDLAQFESQLERRVEEKIFDFQRQQRLKHLIFAAQLSPELLEKFRQMADMIRRLAREPVGNKELKQLLSHKRAMLYFTQPSTRTFLSFMAACQILGITCNEVRDSKTSSEVKRESQMDSIRMFSSYFDVIIMRSPIVNLAESCAYMMNRLESQEMRAVPTINAGSGSDEHPTQALLDMYTIQRTFGFDLSSSVGENRYRELKNAYPDLTEGPASKTYLFCGDIGRGRTVRSLATVLSRYPHQRMFFVSPNHGVLKLDSELKQWLTRAGVEVFEFDSLDAQLDNEPILAQTDCLYMTRIQREHNSEATTLEIESLDLSPFQLTLDRVDKLKQYTPIMHPFPRDSVTQEIPTQVDSDRRVMYFRQARNGMWVRAALLVHLLDAADELFNQYRNRY